MQVVLLKVSPCVELYIVVNVVPHNVVTNVEVSEELALDTDSHRWASGSKDASTLPGFLQERAL